MRSRRERIESAEDAIDRTMPGFTAAYDRLTLPWWKRWLSRIRRWWRRRGEWS